MGAGFFWGLILIVIGISIIFKVVWGVSIMRIVIAIVFILIGVKILVGKSSLNIRSGGNDAIFNDKYVTEFPLTDTEFNTVFGKSVFDFSEAATPTDKSLYLEFNTVFGDTELILPPGLPVKVKAEAVFGSAKLPNDNTAVFGSADYVSEHDSSVTNFVNIKTSAVFGNIVIIQKQLSY